MNRKIGIREVLRPIFALSFLLDKIMSRLLSLELGLTLPQFRILLALQFQSQKSQRAIADFWGIAEASVSRQIGILSRKKLLYRDHKFQNKKEHNLVMTQLGKKKFQEAIGLINKNFEALFKEVGQSERKDITASLNHFIALARANNPQVFSGVKPKILKGNKK